MYKNLTSYFHKLCFSYIYIGLDPHTKPFHQICYN